MIKILSTRIIFIRIISAKCKRSEYKYELFFVAREICLLRRTVSDDQSRLIKIMR